MNVADSLRVSTALEKLGYSPESRPENADVIVLNTCVVRQSAEDKAIGRLTSLKSLKKKNPHLVINLMGCLVGVHGYAELAARFPYVDVFSQPSDPHPLVDFLNGASKESVMNHRQEIDDILDVDYAYTLPKSQQEKMITAFLPIVFGCSHACSYCIIPLKRGREISRPPEEILAEARALVKQGVREISLLGQIVDRYGQDQPGFPMLEELLREMHEIDGLARIRFLTSHPNWVSEKLLDTVAELPKLMPHFELPIQAGDDQVLLNMRRGYTYERFMSIVEKIRARFETVSIATDLIVGFPGESDEQFDRSVAAIQAIHPDMTHVARYSPRLGTLSARQMADDVPAEEKMRRFRVIEKLQKEISTEINMAYAGLNVPVLFEGQSRGRWRGRTPTNKIVFAENEKNLLGKILPVHITWTGPWSLVGNVNSA